MRSTWLAVTVVLAACSTTNNTYVLADGGDSERAAPLPDGAPGLPIVDGGVEDAPVEAAIDATPDAGLPEGGVCSGTDPQGPKSTSCRVGEACSACGDGGFVYTCAGGARPNLTDCTNVDEKMCCRAEWMRAPEDDGFCGRPSYPYAFIGPNGNDGEPVLQDRIGCVRQGAPGGKGTAVICCAK